MTFSRKYNFAHNSCKLLQLLRKTCTFRHFGNKNNKNTRNWQKLIRNTKKQKNNQKLEPKPPETRCDPLRLVATHTRPISKTNSGMIFWQYFISFQSIMTNYHFFGKILSIFIKFIENVANFIFSNKSLTNFINSWQILFFAPRKGPGRKNL